GAFGAAGQRWKASSRVVVVKERAAAFTEKMVARARELEVGNGLRDGVAVGPLVDETQLRSVLEYIEIGKKEGARLLAGGERLQAGVLARGFFVAPTVFGGVEPRMRV